MNAIVQKLNEARKAIVAAAAPGLVLLVGDVATEASKQATGIIAVVAALVLTWLVPNRPPTETV